MFLRLLTIEGKKARVNHFVIVAILKVIPYMNALCLSAVTSLVVIMLLRFAQT